MLPSIKDRGQTDRVIVDTTECYLADLDKTLTLTSAFNFDLQSPTNYGLLTCACTTSRQNVSWFKGYDENTQADGQDRLQYTFPANADSNLGDNRMNELHWWLPSWRHSSRLLAVTLYSRPAMRAICILLSAVLICDHHFVPLISSPILCDPRQIFRAYNPLRSECVPNF